MYRFTKREKIIISVLFIPIGILLILASLFSVYDRINSYTVVGKVQSSEFVKKRASSPGHYQTDFVAATTLSNGKNGDSIETKRQYNVDDEIKVRISKRLNKPTDEIGTSFWVFTILGLVLVIGPLRIWQSSKTSKEVG